MNTIILQLKHLIEIRTKALNKYTTQNSYLAN